MKKLFKITSLVLAGLLFVSLIFGAGVYASGKGWLTFDGQKVTDSNNDLEEIMKIMEGLNAKLENAPEDQAELVSQLQADIRDLQTQLENADQTELVSQLRADITDLQAQLDDAPEDQTKLVSQLKEKIEKLEKQRPEVLAKENQKLREELRKANEAVTGHNIKTEEALIKAQGYETEDVDQE